MDVHFRQLIKMVGVVGIAATHDVVHDNGIDLDTGDAWAAAHHRSQDVHAAPRPNNGEVAMRPKNVRRRGRRCHHQSLPLFSKRAMRLRVHNGAVGVFVNYHPFRAISFAVHLKTRDCIPADVLDILPLGDEHTLRINNVNKPA